MLGIQLHDITRHGTAVLPSDDLDQFAGLQDLLDQANEAAGARTKFHGAGVLLHGLVQGTWFLNEREAGRLVVADVLGPYGIDADAPELVVLVERITMGEVLPKTVARELWDMTRRR